MLDEPPDFPGNLFANEGLVWRVAVREHWGDAGWKAWHKWMSEFERRGIRDVYLIPGHPEPVEETATSVSWQPGGQFVDIDRASVNPILQAVAELSRGLPRA